MYWRYDKINNYVNYEEGLKIYFKYLNKDEYLVRFNNMHEYKNITLNITNLKLKAC